MESQLIRYETLGYHYAGSSFTPNASINYELETNSISIAFERELNFYPLRYTLDGTPPTSSSPLYSAPSTPIFIGGRLQHPTPNTHLRAVTIHNDQVIGHAFELIDLPNLATGKTVEYLCTWETAYPGGENKSLTDAQLASKRGDHPHWQGFRKKDVEVVVDLGEPIKIGRAWMQFFQHSAMTRVMLPQHVEVLGSLDGLNFDKIAKKDLKLDESQNAKIVKVALNFDPVSFRYIKFTAQNRAVLPTDHPYQGMDAWIFTDEIGLH